MGWRKGKALGLKEDGSKEHVKVSTKSDRKGVLSSCIQVMFTQTLLYWQFYRWTCISWLCCWFFSSSFSTCASSLDWPELFLCCLTAFQHVFLRLSICWVSYISVTVQVLTHLPSLQFCFPDVLNLPFLLTKLNLFNPKKWLTEYVYNCCCQFVVMVVSTVILCICSKRRVLRSTVISLMLIEEIVILN